MGHKYKDVEGMAQSIIARFDKSQVVIISTDSTTGKISVISTGKQKKDKEHAAAGAMFIKRTLGLIK